MHPAELWTAKDVAKGPDSETDLGEDTATPLLVRYRLMSDQVMLIEVSQTPPSSSTLL